MIEVESIALGARLSAHVAPFMRNANAAGQPPPITDNTSNNAPAAHAAFFFAWRK